MRRPSPLRPLAAALGLASLPAALPTVWTVDDDFPLAADFFQIGDAVLAAADGDTILVREGVYEPFSVGGKSLTIQGEGLVTVQTDPFFSNGAAVFAVGGVGPSQAVVVRGLSFLYWVLVGNPQTAAFVSACDGPVVLEDCSITAFSSKVALDVSDCASLTLVRCSVTAGDVVYDDFAAVFLPDVGTKLVDSTLHAWDSTFVGNAGTDAFQVLFPPDVVPAGPATGAVRLTRSTLNAFGSSFTGGDGGSVPDPLCLAPTDGAFGLRLADATATVRLLDSTVAGGRGGRTPAACAEPDGLDGAAVLDDGGGTLEGLAGAARSFHWASPVREGEPLTGAYTGEPGDLVLLALALDPVPGVYVEDFELVAQLGPTFALFSRGFVPASGVLPESFTAPALDPGLEAVRVVAQPIFVTAAAEIFNSGPSTTVILDSAF